MINLFNSYKWNTSPTAYMTIDYEYNRNGADMQYRFHWKLWIAYADSWYYNALQLNFMFDDNRVALADVKEYNASEKGWTYEGTTKWITVPNKTTGNTKLVIKVYDKSTSTVKATVGTYLAVTTAHSTIGTLSPFNVDNGITVPVNRYITTINDELDVKCNNTLIKSIPVYTSSVQVTFTAQEKETIYNLMSTVKSAEFEFVLISTLTDSGGANVHTETKSTTGEITDANPSIDIKLVSIADDDESVVAITGNAKTIIQSHSNVVVNIPTGQAKKGASIIKYKLSIGDVSVESAENGIFEFGKMATSGETVLMVTIEDSRGNKTAYQIPFNIVEYYLPIITATIRRKNNYEAETYLNVKVKSLPYGTTSVAQSHAKVGEAIPPAVELESGETTYICDKDFAYNFVITATDSFGGESEKIIVLSKGKFPLFIDTKMNAVGINAFPLDENESLRVAEGYAVFEDGIALKSATEGSNKYFLLSVDDGGQLSITEIGEKRK